MGTIKTFRALLISQNLLGRSLRSVGILTVGSSVENLLRFARNMLLARLLGAEAFGLMATVIATVAAMEAFAEVGLRQSVIQNKKGADDNFLNVIWWFSSLRGLALYGIAYFVTPTICNFFHRPESVDLLRVGFLVILLNGLISPRIHVLEKEFRFKTWVIVMQGSAITGVLAAIALALFLHNVWALVLAYVVEMFLRTVLSFVICPFKPTLKLDSQYIRDIMRYSRGMFGLPILMMLFVQADVFVIGKLLSLELLGMYTLARSLAETPTVFISKAISPVVLSSFSSIQDDNHNLRQSLLEITKVTGTIGFSLMAFLIMFSEHILSLTFGSKYISVAGPFGVLCVYALILIFSSFNMDVYLAVGRPNIHRTASAFRTGLYFLLIIPATSTFGLIGASLSMLTAQSLLLAVQIFYLRRLIGIGALEYIKSWLSGLKLSLIVLVPGIFFRLFFDFSIMVGVIVGGGLCMIAWVIGVMNLDVVKNRVTTLSKP